MCQQHDATEPGLLLKSEDHSKVIAERADNTLSSKKARELSADHGANIRPEAVKT